MLDHKFLSELAVAYLHGPQNKKDKLDYYYQLYEERFEDREKLVTVFRKVTDEIEQMLPEMQRTRWRKKSDFYTLFLELAHRADQLPWTKDRRNAVSERILDLGERVETLLRLEEEDWDRQDKDAVTYARNVARAASDRGSRVARANAFSNFVLQE